MMNNPYQIYNQNVPFIHHTDWASVAKQWATLRADVNIPQSLHEQHNYHIVPPPPPPSPPQEHSLSFQHNSYDSYQPILNQELINPASRNVPISQNANHSYQTPAYTVFEDSFSQAAKSSCETFDYNHGNRPYEYYNNNVESYEPPVTAVNYTQNIWNHPPPDHPDIIRTNYRPETFTPPDPVPAPKLFPIVNANEFHVNNIVTRPPPSLMLNKPSLLPKPVEPKMFVESRFDMEFVAARPSKGLPAWIIDDMKKMKEKERKQSYHSMDAYKDNPLNSRRDDEGDVVMEDVYKEMSAHEYTMSGKHVRKNQLDDSLATETDIIDVNPKDGDIIIGKIDYSSKSLTELIEMFDDTEIETLKMTVIRDSLTNVMKEVTDDMISATVKSTFSRELTRGKKTHKHKGKSDTHGSTANVPRTEVISQLLGLDVYESDDETNEVYPETKLESKPNKSDNSMREKWSSHKKQSDLKDESDSKSSKIKSSNEKSGLDLKEKDKVEMETTSKRKHRSRSRSRDRGRSKEKRKSHKKSKKHSNSTELKDESRKNDHYDKNSGSSRKKN